MISSRISEVFMSFQGEGPYVGVKQLFIRFHGCSLNCAYCDTKPKDYHIFTKNTLLEKVLEYKESFHSISLTGGEPLEQVEFLEEFLPILRERVGKRIYLESNGLLFEKLSRIINFVNVVSMDIKLPSSTQRIGFWEEHKKFLQVAKIREVFVKMIVTDQTDFEEILKAKDIIKKIDPRIPLILQPVDPIGSIQEPSARLLKQFKDHLSKDILTVEIIPQYHKKNGYK